MLDAACYSEDVCLVCARRAAGFGYRPPGQHSKPVAHTCNDLECLDLVMGVYSMRQDDFDRVEAMATIRGGDAAGAYLDEIKKTDLAQLTEDEWRTFCQKLVAGYRVALKTDLKNEAPF